MRKGIQTGDSDGCVRRLTNLLPRGFAVAGSAHRLGTVRL